MVGLSNSQEGWISFEMHNKLKAMDPVRASQYKARKWREYQINRINNEIAEFKQAYEEKLKKDPE